MNRLFLIIFAVFASTLLLTQVVSSAEGKYSEARKQAKEREAKILAEEILATKEKLKKEKKALEPKITTTNTSTASSAKASAEAKNTAKAKAIADAKTALELAKIKRVTAKAAYKNNPSDATKKLEYENAITAEKKAEIDLKLARFD